MTRLSPFLLMHAESALRALLRFDYPADAVLSYYFRNHRALGHADRAFVAELCFLVLRHLRSLSARCEETYVPQRLLLTALFCLAGWNLRELRQRLPEVTDAEAEHLAHAKRWDAGAAPAAVRCDLPDWLFSRLETQWGDELPLLVSALNRPAPLDLRINPLKTSREGVLARLAADGVTAMPTPFSPWGIRLPQKLALSQHPLFLEGCVEVQDEGSQLLGFLLQPKRGEMVLDFCAGSGGKTLLLGALMRSTGRLYALDVSERRLANLKPRLARSGLSNVHPIRIDSENDIRVKRLVGKLDRVLVDAPCSGLGTLRRNPDLKWRQQPEGLAELVQKQEAILTAAARLVKSGGRLVYATCSILHEENEQVVANFLAGHPQFSPVDARAVLMAQGIDLGVSTALGAALRLSPHQQGCDGFFAMAMERQ